MESANNGMCRCCASEGTFKDVKTKYLWMGEEEIYSDMLKECFDITLFTSESGCNGGICEVCITQLRNAANFKRQVLHTEEQFKKRLQGKTLFKSDIVKMEMTNSIDDDGDSDNNFSEDFSTADYEIPIKEEIPVEMKPKKRAAKATTSKTKKPKVEDGESSTTRIQRVITNKSTPKMIPLTGKREKNTNEVSKNKLNNKEHLQRNQYNVQMFMRYSNATPIQNYGHIGYKCCFCEEQFPKAADLKAHTIKDHDDTDKIHLLSGVRINYYVVKLDITSLQCRICDESIDSIEELIEHLINEHGKLLYRNFRSHIIPFKFIDESQSCYLCSKFCHTFKSLFIHLQKHFHNYICETCGASFINFSTISNHLRTHRIGTFKCELCPRIFETALKKRVHERAVHDTIAAHKCGYCNEKFVNDYQRQVHLSQVHAIFIKKKKCPNCDNVYTNLSALTSHIKKVHFNEWRHPCKECKKKFFSAADLRNHMATHTGIKRHICDVCDKAYAWKSNLREHLKVHTKKTVKSSTRPHD